MRTISAVQTLARLRNKKLKEPDPVVEVESQKTLGKNTGKATKSVRQCNEKHAKGSDKIAGFYVSKENTPNVDHTKIKA